MTRSGRPCTARFARLIDGSAVLDVAEACGSAPGGGRAARPARRLVARRRRSSIHAAIEDGALRVVIGVGGTASYRRRRRPSRGLGAGCPATSSWSRRSTCRTRSLGPDGRRRGRSGRRRARRPSRSPSSRSLLGQPADLPTAERAGSGAGGGIGACSWLLGADAPSRARRSWPPRPVGPTRSIATPACASRPRAGSTARPSRARSSPMSLTSAAGISVQCIAVGGIVEPVAAEELRRRGCETHQQGDLERAGRELASRSSSLSG